MLATLSGGTEGAAKNRQSVDLVPTGEGVTSDVVTGGVCRIGVLGPLVLERDGCVLPLPSGHQRSLLALLVLGAGVPVSRDRLIDELWGEHPPSSAVSAMHVHLSKLRVLLGGLLVREPAGYALAPGDFELDVRRFDSLVEQARDDPGRAAALLTRGARLVSGRAVVRCRLGAERRAVATDAGGEATAGDGPARGCRAGPGAAAELLTELERLTDEHPFEEQLWALLIVALYRAGRPARGAGGLSADPPPLLGGARDRARRTAHPAAAAGPRARPDAAAATRPTPHARHAHRPHGCRSRRPSWSDASAGADRAGRADGRPRRPADHADRTGRCWQDAAAGGARPASRGGLSGMARCSCVWRG